MESILSNSLSNCTCIFLCFPLRAEKEHKQLLKLKKEKASSNDKVHVAAERQFLYIFVHVFVHKRIVLKQYAKVYKHLGGITNADSCMFSQCTYLLCWYLIFVGAKTMGYSILLCSWTTSQVSIEIYLPSKYCKHITFGWALCLAILGVKMLPLNHEHS